MRFSTPKEMIKKIRVEHGMHGADIGTGNGAYALLLAELVGESGKVYALDAQEHLADRAVALGKERNMNNIIPVWSNVEEHLGTRLRTDSMDRVVIANVTFQIKNRVNFAKELKRIGKPGSLYLFIDWLDSGGSLAPREDMLIKPESARNLFEAEGFKVMEQFSSGVNHYGFVMTQ